jgi:hypothetical protein
MRVPEVSSLGAHKREETSRSMRRSGLSGVFIRGLPPNKKTTRQRTKQRVEIWSLPPKAQSLKPKVQA